MHCFSTLVDLTIEQAHDHVHQKLVPMMHKIWVSDVRDDDEPDDSPGLSKDVFFKNHRLKNLSITTIWRWMHYLEFKHLRRSKGYYVDGHERKDVVKYRRRFCKRYLTVYEPRCLRWIQLKRSEVLETESIDASWGYAYKHGQTGEEMLEYHIDDVHDVAELQERIATMSVRAPLNSSPIMLVGQDECVFTQYLLGSRMWTGPKGERPLFLKSEDYSIMLSAFQSRTFGFGCEITEEQMATINDKVCENKHTCEQRNKLTSVLFYSVPETTTKIPQPHWR